MNKILRKRSLLNLLIGSVVLVNVLFLSCGRREFPARIDTKNGGTESTVQFASCPGTILVKIQNKSFSPSNTNIPVDTTVMWDNYDQAVYSLISGTVPENGSFSTPEIQPGYSICLKFTAPGTYNYTSNPALAAMEGTIIVSP